MRHPLVVTIGFEMEATLMSVYMEGRRVQRTNKHVMTPTISVYADRLTGENYQGVRQRIQKFMHTHGLQHEQQQISTKRRSSGTYTVRFEDDTSLAVQLQNTPKFFNDAEFILTYPERVHLSSVSELLPFIRRSLHKACQDLDEIFSDFVKKQIQNTDFPYKNMFFKDNVRLFTSRSNLVDIPFACQITIMVDMYHAKEVISFLTGLLDTHVRKQVIPIYNKCEQFCQSLFRNVPKDYAWLSDYLFLFIYSFKTINYRKMYPVILRVLFSWQWKHYIGKQGLHCLDSILQSQNVDKKSPIFYKYFQQVHGMQPFATSAVELEDMEATTFLQEKDMIGIEFRAMKYFVKDMMVQTGLRSPYFTLATCKAICQRLHKTRQNPSS